MKIITFAIRQNRGYISSDVAKIIRIIIILCVCILPKAVKTWQEHYAPNSNTSTSQVNKNVSFGGYGWTKQHYIEKANEERNEARLDMDKAQSGPESESAGWIQLAKEHEASAKSYENMANNAPEDQ